MCISCLAAESAYAMVTWLQGETGRDGLEHRHDTGAGYPGSRWEEKAPGAAMRTHLLRALHRFVNPNPRSDWHCHRMPSIHDTKRLLLHASACKDGASNAAVYLSIAGGWTRTPHAPSAAGR